jgi:hypothetical protein
MSPNGDTGRISKEVDLRMVLSTHGARTRGPWQQRCEPHVRQKDYLVRIHNELLSRLLKRLGLVDGMH